MVDPISAAGAVHRSPGALPILDSLAMTAEAWLARAGYSVDLNNDGHIGHTGPVTIEPVRENLIEPITLNGPSGTKLLANEQTDVLQAAEPEAPPPPAPVTVDV